MSWQIPWQRRLSTWSAWLWEPGKFTATPGSVLLQSLRFQSWATMVFSRWIVIVVIVVCLVEPALVQQLFFWGLDHVQLSQWWGVSCECWHCVGSQASLGRCHTMPYHGTIWTLVKISFAFAWNSPNDFTYHSFPLLILSFGYIRDARRPKQALSSHCRLVQVQGLLGVRSASGLCEILHETNKTGMWRHVCVILQHGPQKVRRSCACQVFQGLLSAKHKCRMARPGVSRKGTAQSDWNPP